MDKGVFMSTNQPTCIINVTRETGFLEEEKISIINDFNLFLNTESFMLS